MLLSTFSVKQAVRFALMNETQLSLEIVKRLEEKAALMQKEQSLTTHGDIRRLQQEANSLLDILKEVKEIKNETAATKD